MNNIDDKIVVFDEKDYLNKTSLINNIRSDIVVSNNIQINPPGNYRLIYIEPSIFPWKISNKNVLVTLTPGNYRFRIPKYYSKIYLNKISEDVFTLQLPNTMEKYRFRILNNKVEYVEKPIGIYGKAYVIIRDAVIEYGELSIRDAVNIIVKELGVTKDNARKILSKLVVDKYIRVENGFISIY